MPLKILLTLIFALTPVTAMACSAFFLDKGKGKWMGKSYDWHNGEGFVLVNKRFVKKTALLKPNSRRKPLKWTSRFGSITFNQYGREFPLGGMNEKGLAIEVLWLYQTKDSFRKNRKATLNELQWIQYHLDTSANVKEVLAKSKKLHIERAYAKVHYFLCDAKGQCAVVELLKGKLTVYHQKTLPFPVLTNSTYARSRRYFIKKGGLRKKHRVPSSNGSLPRFFRIAANVRKLRKPKASGLKQSFYILRNVRAKNSSQWNIVYDLKKKRIHFGDAWKRKWQTVTLQKQDFRCGQPSVLMDMRGTLVKGKRHKWVRYTSVINTRLIKRSIRKLRRSMGGPRWPKRWILGLARYPGRNVCVRKK